MEDKLLNFTVLIEQDEEGMYIAKVPDIAGCYTQGKTVQDALERTREAILVCLPTLTGEKLSFHCMEMKSSALAF